MSYRGFFDESGIHAGARHCVAAGFWANESDWPTFEKAWRGATGGAGFHAKKLLHRRRQSARRPKANDRLSKLLAAINDSTLRPVVAAVDIGAFESLTSAQREYLTGAIVSFSTLSFVTEGKPWIPYYVAVQLAVTNTVKMLPPGDARVWFTLDEQRTYKDHAQRSFALAQALATHDLRRRLAGLDYGSRNGFPGLQAADLLAAAATARLRPPETRTLDDTRLIVELKAMKRGSFVIFGARDFRAMLDRDVPFLPAL